MELQHIIKPAITIAADASLHQAVSQMIEHQTNSLLVTDAAGKLVGEVNVSSLLDAIVPEYLDGDNIAAHFASTDMFEEAVKDAADQQVTYFMDSDVHAVRDTEGIMSIATTAVANKKAHIPVIDADGAPVGMISRRGIKHILAEVLNIADPA